MIHGTLRLSTIAFCATALASLIPLSSAGAAPAEMRHHGAAGSAVYRQATATHAQVATRGHRFGSTGMRAHVFGHRHGYRRYGYRHYRHGYVVGGVIGGGYAYPYYTGGYYAYGYGRRHSCWWYYRYDPADMPSWCSAYGYAYPSYSYDYGYVGPSYGFAFAFGGGGFRHHHHHHHFAFQGAANPSGRFAFHNGTRPLEGRAANVSGATMQSGAHNFVTTPGATHFGGGAHVGGQRFVH